MSLSIWCAAHITAEHHESDVFDERQAVYQVRRDRLCPDRAQPGCKQLSGSVAMIRRVREPA
jgi:hypothetical protein